MSKSGKYFYIRSQLAGSLVIELQSAIDKPGVPVVTAEARSEVEGNDHQLWYTDFTTGTIRSKLNSYCIEVRDDIIVAMPFRNGNGNQQWVLDEKTGLVQSQEDFELVIGISNDKAEVASACVANGYEGLEGQHWTFEYRPAMYFYIRTEKHDKVMDVKGGSTKPGTKVIIYDDKGDMADNQLWYEDKNGVLHSKLNDYCLDGSGREVVLFPYDEMNEKQKWVLNGNLIQNRIQKNLVLQMKTQGAGLFRDPIIIACDYTGSANQIWNFDYIPDQSLSLNHSGNGKHFILRSRMNGLVLEARDTGELGIEIVTSYRSRDPAIADNQLFFQDELTGTIRSSTNDYCLTFSDDRVIARPYDPFDSNMQWRVFGRKLQSKKKFELVMHITEGSMEPDSSISISNYNGDECQHFEVTHQPARSFMIISLMHGKCIDIKGDDASSGAKVIMYDRKPTISTNQLWYEDERGIIRSKLNGYAIEATGKGAKMRPYDPTNANMQWIIVGDRLQSRADPKLVLDIHKASKSRGADIISYKFTGAENQRWKFEYI